MRSRRVLIALLILAAACSRPTTFDSVTAIRPDTLPIIGAPAAPLDVEAAVHAIQVRRWNETVWWNTVAAAPGLVSKRISSPNRTGVATDLPPDWVIQRESGGDYAAFNPTGCGGAGCYGRYQFSGEWAGKLGLPADLSTATPAQQDAAARELWNGGAGCGNWDACRG